MKCPQVAFSLVNSPRRTDRHGRRIRHQFFHQLFKFCAGWACGEEGRGGRDKCRPCRDPFELRTVIYIKLTHLRLVADPNLKALTTGAAAAVGRGRADAPYSLPCVINSERWQPQRSGILCWTSESGESENIVMDFFYILFSTWMTALRLRPLNRL